MGRQIIKQPNGKYCVFSTVVDSVVYYNMTQEELVKEFANDYGSYVQEKIIEIIEKLEVGGKPYYQFTMDYEEMMETIKDIHGDKEFNEVKKVIEKDNS